MVNARSNDSSKHFMCMCVCAFVRVCMCRSSCLSISLKIELICMLSIMNIIRFFLVVIGKASTTFLCEWNTSGGDIEIIVELVFLFKRNELRREQNRKWTKTFSFLVFVTSRKWPWHQVLVKTTICSESVAVSNHYSISLRSILSMKSRKSNETKKKINIVRKAK
jgi:hypothetical protein